MKNVFFRAFILMLCIVFAFSVTTTAAAWWKCAAALAGCVAASAASAAICKTDPSTLACKAAIAATAYACGKVSDYC